MREPVYIYPLKKCVFFGSQLTVIFFQKAFAVSSSGWTQLRTEGRCVEAGDDFDPVRGAAAARQPGAARGETEVGRR